MLGGAFLAAAPDAAGAPPGAADAAAPALRIANARLEAQVEALKAISALKGTAGKNKPRASPWHPRPGSRACLPCPLRNPAGAVGGRGGAERGLPSGLFREPQPDGSQLAGHSLRAGLATAAALADVSEHAIMRQTRHRNVEVFRGYVRVASLFKRNAAAAVGL